MQVTRQALALVLARGLQVPRQLGELGGALAHLDLQPVTLGLHQALLLQQLVGQHLVLAQHHDQRQQADRAEQGHANAADQQGAQQFLVALGQHRAAGPGSGQGHGV